MSFLSRLFSKKVSKPSHMPLDGHQMTSLVLLSKSYIDLDIDRLRTVLDALFPGEFLPPRDSGNFVVDGPVKQAMFMIMSNIEGYSGGFMLNSVPATYDHYSDYRNYIQDPEILSAVSSHKCWLSVDRLMPQGTTEEHYRFIGLLLSALAPDDSIAVVHPSKMHVVLFNQTICEKLSSDGYSNFN